MQQANAGNPQAENILGADYDNGEGGLPLDPAKAAYWIKRSAKQGYAAAEYNMGWYYENGMDGLPKDLAKAAYWYRQCAAQNFLFCLARLRHVQQMAQQVTAATPPPVQPTAHAVATPVADHQQALQNLQRFWTLYFQASNAQVVDFGEPALVRPVGFGDTP
ncbi:MAG: tetratricopeptide repeat protein [Acidiferrobacteraceae bacterium]